MAKRKRTLRIGVIGTGKFAEQCHLPGLQSHPHARVVAICGRRPERLRVLAARFNIPAVHTDYHEICARSDLDAITIVTPNSEHAEQAKAAFSAGKHVFCEKPMATNVAHAHEMVHAAELSGKVHQIGFIYRYLYGLQELRRRVQRGDIGVPYHLRAQHNSWDGLQPASELGYRATRELGGGGVLYDVGSHLFDVARFLFGPLKSVTGFIENVPRSTKSSRGKAKPVDTDDLATAWFTHESGVRGQWFASRAMPWYGEKAHVEVIGRDGTLRASLSRGGIDVLRSASPSRPEWKVLPLPREARNTLPSALNIMMRSFVDACLRGTLNGDVDASFHDGLACQLAIDAVEQATVRLPWVPLATTGLGRDGKGRNLSVRDKKMVLGVFSSGTNKISSGTV